MWFVCNFLCFFFNLGKIFHLWRSGCYTPTAMDVWQEDHHLIQDNLWWPSVFYTNSNSTSVSQHLFCFCSIGQAIVSPACLHESADIFEVRQVTLSHFLLFPRILPCQSSLWLVYLILEGGGGGCFKKLILDTAFVIKITNGKIANKNSMHKHKRKTNLDCNSFQNIMQPLK